LSRNNTPGEKYYLGLGFTLFDDPRYIIENAKKSDAFEFIHSVWLPEAWTFDAFSCLSSISTQTTKVKLATGVVNVFSRSAASIAMSVATLNLISNGRAILGLGISGKSVIEDWHSMKFDRPFLRLREYLDSIRRILKGQRMNYSGALVSVKRFKLGVPLIENNVIPIYLASMGEKMLSLAYEIADGALVYFHPLKSLKETLTRLNSKYGKRIWIACYLPFSVSNNKKEAYDNIKNIIAYYAGGMGDYYNRMLRTHGFVEEAQKIKSYWSSNEREKAKAAVTDEIVDSIAIAGDIEDCREKIIEFKKAGVDLPILIHQQQSMLSNKLVDFNPLRELTRCSFE
jgi:alkanesulfonate monooxygenase SsuD/methylene tetrahydromethanopterin reductase-like flavin-dependent oxidoreductase (luciferase family)